MNEFDPNFDPNDEYMSLDADDNSGTVAPNQPQNTPQNNDEPVEVETVDDDVFEAFENALNTPSPYSQPSGHPAADNTQQQRVQPTPPPVAPPAARYAPPTAPVYNQPQQMPPQYVQPQQTPPQYMPPQYMPPAQTAAQYNTPVVQYQAPNHNPQYGGNQPVQQYRPAPVAPANPSYAQNSVQPPVQPQPYNPYQQNAGQSAQPYNPYTPPVVNQKSKTPKKTKVLIGVLIGFLVVFLVGFTIYCCSLIFDDNNTNRKADNPLAQYATEPEEFFDEFYGGDFYNSLPDGFSLAPQYNGDYLDEKVTLQADEGHTQKSASGENGNTSEPDKDAKGIELNKPPKDEDNKKYTTQYAYNAVTDSVVSILCYEDEITDDAADIISEGTGTIISSDGYIVTNSHVIGDSNTYAINVVLNNAEEYKAKVVGFDTRTDLAVLKIKGKDLSYAKFCDSSAVEVGQDIVAIGNPGGQSFQNSLTKGIVSAVDRELELSTNVNYIQLDAAINPGNSGGPLCNLYGQVIGINTAKIASEEYEGMGFAIPSNTVAEIANDLIHYGYVKDRVMLGLMGLQVDDEMVHTYDVPYGILITSISEDGPLDNKNIMEYDILTAINDVEVKTFQDVYKELSKYKPGDKVTLTLYRLEE